MKKLLFVSLCALNMANNGNFLSNALFKKQEPKVELSPWQNALQNPHVNKSVNFAKNNPFLTAIGAYTALAIIYGMFKSKTVEKKDLSNVVITDPELIKAVEVLEKHLGVKIKTKRANQFA